MLYNIVCSGVPRFMSRRLILFIAWSLVTGLDQLYLLLTQSPLTCDLNIKTHEGITVRPKDGPPRP